MPVPKFLQQPLTLYEIAEQYWDLRAYPSQHVFSLLAHVSEDRLEKDKCAELSSSEGQEDWLNYCRRPRRTILEVLHDFHKSASKLTMATLFELFSTVKPRSFSIASSCLPSNRRLDVLVAVVQYTTKLKKPRLGLCSNWLKGLQGKVYGWIKNGTFKFPDDTSIPLILIGPGTGLAPFRSLLQTRTLQRAASRRSLHVFAGARYRRRDLHCAAELRQMEADGGLALYCAFSRDTDRKIYVQHKIAEHCEVVWRLMSSGARVYISGNAKNMPDNVRDAIVEDVICKVGGLTMEESRSYLKNMENTGLLQVETW